MPERFFGPWTVRVVDSHFPDRQRYEITGSDGADGTYPGTPDATVGVSGAEWTLKASRREGGVWRSCAIQRSAATTTNHDGLVVTVGVDDSPPGTPGALDYDDMILVLHSEDPSLAPVTPWQNPYDFTLPQQSLRFD